MRTSIRTESGGTVHVPDSGQGASEQNDIRGRLASQGYEKHDVNDLGFGSSLERYSKGGTGETSTYLNVLWHNKQIVSFRVTPNTAFEVLRRAILPASRCMKKNTYVTCVDLKNSQLFHDGITEQLGEMPGFELGNKEMEYFEFLTDPLNHFKFGETCGHPAFLLPGRIAINSLLELDQEKILFAVLRGANPVGRIYALTELYRKYRCGALSNVEQLKKDSQVLLGLELKIETCYGSFEEERSARWFVTNVNKKIEKIGCESTKPQSSENE